ncbi:hypothetical protein HPP92_019821 [Vanilla planifolia]|uniref:Inositol polyphosphate-related phosphatase domain-containing protein n=1 Tax=Vanilla planifolia TaxID=51239 RepID=A0A835Q9I8_VANPL|nr:hypothetical protein HPP92_019821 [Vanilla planifolia]
MRYIKGYNIEPRPQLLIRCGDRLHLPPLNPTHTHSSASRSLQRRGRQRHRLPGLKPNIGRRPCLRSKAMRTIYAKVWFFILLLPWFSLRCLFSEPVVVHQSSACARTVEALRANREEIASLIRTNSSSFKDISAEWLVNTSEALKPASCPPQTIRMFVGTWNVGGRAPYSDLNLREWLDGPSATTADVYVSGGRAAQRRQRTRRRGQSPAVKWLSLIRRALNRTRYEYPDASSVEDVSEPAAAALTPAAWKPEDPRSGGNRKATDWWRASRWWGSSCAYGLRGARRRRGRRNADVVKILKKTRFTHSWDQTRLSPYWITIWLGDLNYRLSASWDEMKELLEEKDWEALLKKDQLRREQRAGRVLVGWEEGQINFPPTCDRILWRGKGMKQHAYVRGESRFSDHRPVCAVFSVELDGEKPGGVRRRGNVVEGASGGDAEPEADAELPADRGAVRLKQTGGSSFFLPDGLMMAAAAC